MKKILFLINNLRDGGAEKVLVNLVNNMNHKKYDITLRTLFDGGVNKQFLSDKITYESIFKRSFKGSNYLHYLPSFIIYNIVARGTFDVIIVYLHGVLTKIIAKAPKSQKTIAYLHSNMQKSPFIKSFPSKKSIQKCFNSYNAIVSVSKSVEDSFIKVSGINHNLKVIYNTFDVPNIKSKSEEDIEHDLLKSDKLKMCAVGKLIKIKGFDRLIDVCAKLKQNDINFSLLIIGEGVERKKLESKIAEFKLENNIKLIGFKSNPYKYISKCDLLVSSSITEGFSSVVVESIILGVPVIATNTAGMKEILGENNEYGLIVENDENALYIGLKGLLTNNDLLRQYKFKASSRSTVFSVENSVEKFEELIENL